MNITWQKPEDWVEDPGAFPNDLVLLLVEVGPESKRCLVDAVEGTRYVTMGHWYPDFELSNNTKEPGHWEYVGWNWSQDCFVGTQYDKVIGWSLLPKV